MASPGLEAAVLRELSGLVAGPVDAEPGGVRFEASVEQGALLSACTRTAGRVLLVLDEGPAPSLDALAARVRRVDWKPFLVPGAPVEVHVAAHASHMRFRGPAEKKVGLAIEDALRGPRLPRDSRAPLQTQRVQVRLDENIATISLDAGGELLHVRGWRTETGRAPIRENLAATLLYIAGWSGDEPLLDPFCGVGTIPIEAALLAAGRPPWTRRRFAWEDWPGLRGLRLPDPRRALPGAALVPSQIFGADKEEEALVRAESNARHAGVRVSWQQCDVAQLRPPCEAGLLIANPPYGHRLGSNVGGVYSAFGRSLREGFAGWRALFLAPSVELARRVHRDVEPITSFSNGGLRVSVFGLVL